MDYVYFPDGGFPTKPTLETAVTYLLILIHRDLTWSVNFSSESVLIPRSSPKYIEDTLHRYCRAAFSLLLFRLGLLRENRPQPIAKAGKPSRKNCDEHRGVARTKKWEHKRKFLATPPYFSENLLLPPPHTYFLIHYFSHAHIH